MGKNPAFQFYPRDWLSDTELQQASASTRGIWTNLLSHMWFSQQRGVVSGTVQEMCQLGGCTESEWLIFYEQNCRLKFADVTFCDGIVTVKNRRMVREEKARESARLRKSRERSRESHTEVTLASPSTPSTPSPKSKYKDLVGTLPVPTGDRDLPVRVRRNEIPEGFSEWWNEYPKKVGKKQAVIEWKRLNPSPDLQAIILDAIRKQKRSIKAMLENDRHHILDPERWIKYSRWEDELPSVVGTGPRYPQL
jgi:hypothetical protein